MSRSSGVLMHVSSLWGKYSIGGFGKSARQFIDFLSDAGFTYWQVLPFCMCDDSNSPYRSYSAFAGNPYFIDLETLAEKGLLLPKELSDADQATEYLCEYDVLAKTRIKLLRSASERLGDTERRQISDFIDSHAELGKAARFLALKDTNGGTEWQSWGIHIPREDHLLFWQFVQYEFFTQWDKIKQYANQRGIRIIGDMPIYVSLDSADVWANREQFLLDACGMPTSVAGVPPDYFCEDGQLWGNPLYDWKQMQSDGFSWWKRRLRHMLDMFDGVRIDHFRAFESYWSVPADATSAKCGKWEKGPDKALIDVLRTEAGDKLVIAEDLGDITPQVCELLKYSEFPGMKVLQFAFLGDTSSPHLPHNYNDNCVAYTGTHDNNTLLGFIWEMPEHDRRRLFDYFSCDGNDWSHDCEKIVKHMLASRADTVILPIQDLLVFGADTRMNTPGTARGNWGYRITEEQLLRIDRKRFLHLNRLYGRK